MFQNDENCSLLFVGGGLSLAATDKADYTRRDGQGWWGGDDKLQGWHRRTRDRSRRLPSILRHNPASETPDLLRSILHFVPDCCIDGRKDEHVCVSK